jgi:hypothetical protein
LTVTFGMNARSRQRGRSGALMLLVVFAIAGVLGALAIKQVLGPVASSKGRGGDPDAAEATVQSAVTQGNAAPGSALERARGLEDALKRQQEDLDKRIDNAQTGAAK